MRSSLQNLEIYQEAMSIGEDVWALTSKWDRFAKDTIARQVVRSADSIAANLAEGYGRYHFKENQKFCYYSRGSAEETQTWIEKSVHRELIEREPARTLYDKIENYKKRLNAYISSIGTASSPADR